MGVVRAGNVKPVLKSIKSVLQELETSQENQILVAKSELEARSKKATGFFCVWPVTEKCGKAFVCIVERTDPDDSEIYDSMIYGIAESCTIMLQRLFDHGFDISGATFDVETMRMKVVNKDRTATIELHSMDGKR